MGSKKNKQVWGRGGVVLQVADVRLVITTKDSSEGNPWSTLCLHTMNSRLQEIKHESENLQQG